MNIRPLECGCTVGFHYTDSDLDDWGDNTYAYVIPCEQHQVKIEQDLKEGSKTKS